jgi:hypothetical protein
MATTYEPIATTTLGTATNSITFSSISSAYTDLRVVWVLTGVSSTATPSLRLNGVSTTSYSFTTLRGNGTDVASARYSDNLMYLSGTNAITTATSTVLLTVDIFSYTGSTKKTCLSKGSLDRDGAGASVVTVGLFDSTSAINSVTVLLSGGWNQSVGTTATLYGIKAA